MSLRWMILMMVMGQCLSTLTAGTPRDRLFTDGWRFLRGDAPGAENPAFDDSAWRLLDVPHDWSIEDLPASEEGAKPERVGPFSPHQSAGGHFTGYTVGGDGWYRKHFVVDEPGKRVAVRFDGVYMNTEIWINGRFLGNHPHGYTSFEFDLTPHLNPPGQDNVLAVRVRNEGRNSRWYSGSGIYRHVWLTTRGPIHVPTWGVFVTTPEVSADKALVSVAIEVRNDTSVQANAVVRVRMRDAVGNVVSDAEDGLHLPSDDVQAVGLPLEVLSPKLWAPDTPDLYTAEVEVVVAGTTVDAVSTRFGIRTIEFDAERGFLLNGEPVLLKGGNVHHDNGPLGAKAIDRAEERRVELLKANGFNAIRCSHNPPSSAFLEACDRLGMLVIDEAFDAWNEPKENRDGSYHRYFKDWFARDIAAMVRRDRNHPSVIMWSVGNEIPEQFRDPDTGDRLREAILSHDKTRPVTQAICTDWGPVIRNWDGLSDPAFTHLDVAGYNYLPDKYESDHARHPQRVMYGAESFPKDVLAYWSLVEKHTYVIGDFVWSAMDYLGEAGIAHSVLSNEENPFFMSWPWYNAWCGDLDICGFKKPQSYYRDVVWGRSEIEMFVHSPIADGLSEIISWWGWPDESKSWNWAGQEGEPLQVSVYTRCDRVRLELNGELVGEQAVSESTRLTAKFDVPYEPGTLRAIGIKRGRAVAETQLETSGTPYQIRLAADRTTIQSSRQDLSFVTVEVVDAAGQRVMNGEVDVHFSVSGVGELAAQANGKPDAPASFESAMGRTHQGRCLAILRPTGSAGEIRLHAEAQGLIPATLTVECQDTRQ